MAVGMGYDIHRLAPGRKLILGGVEIPHDRGLLGHSDGDVVVHAVIDALLGAAGAGDIGTKFPDSDPAWKNASSVGMLESVVRDLRADWTVGNVDVTILAEVPKIAPHRDAILGRLRKALGIDRVSLKAKTMEGLGPVGEKKAIACHAVVELKPHGSK